MYNKIFTKILDSSIWLEPDHTRLVWLTLVAAMDEDGFAAFASIPNLAHRAIVPVESAEKAIATLEGPDPHSSDPDNDGRRIERVPGGWVILNAPKYRELVTRHVAREQGRERVRRHRERKRAAVTGNAGVTEANDPVTQSEADTTTKTITPPLPSVAPPPSGRADRPKRQAAATRIPDNFTLTPERREIAEQEGLDPERTFATFVDYWRAASGANARKLDWDATWRNWCRREADRNNKPGGNGNGNQVRTFDAIHGRLAGSLGKR